MGPASGWKPYLPMRSARTRSSWRSSCGGRTTSGASPRRSWLRGCRGGGKAPRNDRPLKGFGAWSPPKAGRRLAQPRLPGLRSSTQPVRRARPAETEVDVASPFVHARFEPRLYERVLQAAAAQGVTVSGFVREAVEAKLDDASRLASERAKLLAEARSFLQDPDGGREAHHLVSCYVAAVEAQAGRLSAFEARGRARALAEIAGGALEPLDGQELTFAEFRPDGPPVALELAATPRRRGFLRAALAAERARALLEAAPEPSPLPSAAGLLGEARTKELFNEALGWPGMRPVFCASHGMTPCAPSSDGARCYLGCSLRSPEVA